MLTLMYLFGKDVGGVMAEYVLIYKIYCSDFRLNSEGRKKDWAGLFEKILSQSVA